MYEDFTLFLVEVLSDSAYPGKLPVERVVQNLVFSMHGLKDAAHDLDHMQTLIALQVESFLATADPAESG